jgi:tRNA(fMet)-specific endonuclease VapC
VISRAVNYHLDSSACGAVLRLPPGTVPPMAERWNATEVFISSIVAAELEVGVYKSNRPEIQRERLDLLYARVSVCEFDLRAASQYGEIRAELEREGIKIGPLDLLIAAHAFSCGATLVTANLREFKRVKGLKTLAWK